MKFILSFFIFMAVAHAQKAQLTVVDPHIDASPLSDQYEIHRPAPHANKFPTRAEREEFLRDLTSIKEWDELQRDLFYMDYQKLKIHEVMKKYPEVSEKDYSILRSRK